MTIFELFSFFKEYEGVIGTFGGGVVGWLGQNAKNRLQAQRNTIDAEQLENEQLALALSRERFLTDRLNDLVEDTETLWRRLYEREGVVKAYHSAALAARRMVNELEIKLGRNLTIFPDLPDYPPADDEEVGCPTKNERGEPYYVERSQSSDPSSPMGGWKEVTSQKDNRSPKRN